MVQVLYEDLHSQIPSLFHVPLQNLPKKKTFNVKHKILSHKRYVKIYVEGTENFTLVLIHYFGGIKANINGIGQIWGCGEVL